MLIDCRFFTVANLVSLQSQEHLLLKHICDNVGLRFLLDYNLRVSETGIYHVLYNISSSSLTGSPAMKTNSKINLGIWKYMYAHIQDLGSSETRRI